MVVSKAYDVVDICNSETHDHYRQHLEESGVYMDMDVSCLSGVSDVEVCLINRCVYIVLYSILINKLQCTLNNLMYTSLKLLHFFFFIFVHSQKPTIYVNMDEGECISDDSISGVKVCMYLLYMLGYRGNCTQTNI